MASSRVPCKKDIGHALVGNCLGIMLVVFEQESIIRHAMEDGTVDIGVCSLWTPWIQDFQAKVIWLCTA